MSMLPEPIPDVLVEMCHCTFADERTLALLHVTCHCMSTDVCPLAFLPYTHLTLPTTLPVSILSVILELIQNILDGKSNCTSDSKL